MKCAGERRGVVAKGNAGAAAKGKDRVGAAPNPDPARLGDAPDTPATPAGTSGSGLLHSRSVIATCPLGQA
jgi:hypothetical protein